MVGKWFKNNQWMKKGLISFLMLALLTSSFPAMLGLQQQASASQSKLFGGGSGTKEDPYLIKGLQHLINISQFSPSESSKVYFRLEQDIEEIPTSSPFMESIIIQKPQNESSFEFHFDGNSKTIKNLFLYKLHNDNVGLFKEIPGVNSTVKDLTIEVFHLDGRTNVGALAGTNEGTISNVTVTTSTAEASPIYRPGIRSTSNHDGGVPHNFGGIVGHNKTTGVIENSTSNALIVLKDVHTIGGIVGHNEGKLYNNVSNVNFELTNSNTIGGIAGNNMGDVLANESHLTFVSGKSSNLSHVGGLIGRHGDDYHHQSPANHSLVMYNSVNVNMNISNTSGTMPEYIGGLIGYAFRGTAAYNVVQGNVNLSQSTILNVGGLVGEVKLDTSSQFTIDNNFINVAIRNGQNQYSGVIGNLDTLYYVKNLFPTNNYYIQPSGSTLNDATAIVTGYHGERKIESVAGNNSTNQALYPHFNFTDDWSMDDGNGGSVVPHLRNTAAYIKPVNKEIEIWENQSYSLSEFAHVYDLNGEILPEEELEWSLSPTISGVSLDESTGTLMTSSINTGSAVLSVQLKSDTYAEIKKKIKAEIGLNMVPPSITMDSIITTNLDPDQSAIGGDYQATFNIVSNGGASENYTWSTSNPNITVDEEGHVLIGELTTLGSHWIRATSDFSPDEYVQFEFTVVAPYVEIIKFMRGKDVISEDDTIIQQQTWEGSYTVTVNAVGNASVAVIWEVYKREITESGIEYELIPGAVYANNKLKLPAGIQAGENYVIRVSSAEHQQNYLERKLTITGITKFEPIQEGPFIVHPGQSLYDMKFVIAEYSAGGDFTLLYALSDDGTDIVFEHDALQFYSDGTVEEVAKNAVSGTLIKLRVTSEYNPAFYEDIALKVGHPITGIDLGKSEINVKPGSRIVIDAKAITESESEGMDTSVGFWFYSNPELTEYENIVDWSNNVWYIKYDRENNEVVFHEELVEGTYYIQVYSTLNYEIFDVITVTVRNSPIESLTLDQENLYVLPGASAQLTHTISAYDDETDPSVSWSSSDPTGVIVSNTGEITVLPTAEAKDYIITVKSNSDEATTATATVSVMKVNEVTLNETALTLYQGNTSALTASVDVSNGKAPDSRDVIWSSSHPNMIIVDEVGNIIVANDANPTIDYSVSATSKYDTTQSAMAIIKVLQIDDIQITAEKNTIQPGEELQLIHEVSGSSADVSQEVNWSSGHPTAIQVDVTGKVTALTDAEPGIYEITATSKEAPASKGIFEVEIDRVEEVVIQPIENSLVLGGDLIQLTGAAIVNGGLPTDVYWSYEAEGIDVDETTGTISIHSDAELGEYTIRASSVVNPAKFDEITLTVIQVDEVEVSTNKVHVHQGSNSNLIANVYVLDGDEGFIWNGEDSDVVTWRSSDETGRVSVNDEGIVHVASDAVAGEYVITATSVKDDRISGTITIKVTAITSVSVSPEYSSLLAGQEVQLSATVKVAGPADVVDDVATTVIWSVDDPTEKVTIDASGHVKVLQGVLPGEYVVNAVSTVDDQKIGTAIIEVVGINNVEITEVVEGELNLIKGDVLQLNAEVRKSGNVSDAVVWSSEQEIMVSVSATGLVTVLPNAVPGKYTITASSEVDPSVSDTITITVIEVKDVTVTPANLVLHQGEGSSLVAMVEVNNGDEEAVVWNSADAGIVTWSSSDEASVSVDEEGNVTVSPDAEPTTYTITAISVKDDTVQGTATIRVTAVMSVKVSPSEVTLWEGIHQQFEAEVIVEGDIDQEVIWLSSDETAIEVDQTGVVTVLESAEAGMYTVTATSALDNRKFAEATVFVAVINGVIVNQKEVALQAGESVQLHAAASIDGVVTSDIYWSSEDPAIVVDQTGHITVSSDIEPGDYMVRAAIDVERSIYEEVVIRVFEVKDISIDQSEVIVHQGKTVQLIATMVVENGDASAVVWTSSNPEAVSVVDGLVTVFPNATPGSYTVIAASAHNSAIKDEATIIVTAVLGVSIDPDKATISAGKELALTVQVEVSGEVDQSVIWSSSNDDMVKVSEDGVVTVVSNAKAGNYTITATSTVDDTKFAQVIVTVPRAYVPTPTPTPDPMPEPELEEGSNPDNNEQGTETNEEGAAPSTEASPTGAVFNNDKVDQEQLKQSIIEKVEQIRSSVSPNEDVEPTKPTLSFNDVKEHWADTTINQAVSLAFINGYADGSFRPNAVITRAEFATIIAKVFEINAAEPSSSFEDVTNHWAKSAIEALVSAGIVSGYGDGSFAPDKEITREEMIVIISRIVNLQTVAKDTTKGEFADLDQANSYATDMIISAAQAGIINGKGANKFDPQGQATRAEALTIIFNALKLDADIATVLEQLN